MLISTHRFHFTYRFRSLENLEMMCSHVQHVQMSYNRPMQRLQHAGKGCWGHLVPSHLRFTAVLRCERKILSEVIVSNHWGLNKGTSKLEWDCIDGIINSPFVQLQNRSILWEPWTLINTTQIRWGGTSHFIMMILYRSDTQQGSGKEKWVL